MAAVYPSALISTTQLPNNRTLATLTDNAGVDHPDEHNQIADELIAIETHLGTNVAGSATNLKTRLDAVLTARKTADQTNATTTFANVTDLVFPVVVGGDYLAEFFIMWSTGTAGVVARYTLTFPAVTNVAVWFEQLGVLLPTTGGTAAVYDQSINTSGTDPSGFVGGTSIPAANVNTITHVRALFGNVTTAGSVQLQHKAETTGTITTRRGSFGRLTSN